MRKYFFFDIDGTLTTPLTAEYPDSTREAIRKLQERGHFVSLATGRIQADAVKVAEELEIRALVSDGGNAITLDGEILYHEGLPLALCRNLLADIDEERHPWAVATKNRKYRIARTERYLHRVEDRYYETDIIPGYDARKAETIYKIFIACRGEEKNEIPLHGLPYVWFRKDTMLIEPVHKERGIFELMKKYNLTDEQIVVFGDGTNDCSMFRREWMTVAMGNGKISLKERAKYITKNADDDGIYHACRYFGWI